ncbi:tetraacyldisaccharide 4'-kinase [bacterium]|nr:tetraacyldisaccharide 4'-kinase [bacterium]
MKQSDFERLFYKRPAEIERQPALWPLRAASFVYALAMRVRAAAYRAGILAGVRPAIPAISVGNITVGGTGKTPLAYYVAERLREMGRRPAIVSRGYRGAKEGAVAVVGDGKSLKLTAAEAGDEPFMMAVRVPRIPVVIGARRADAVAHAAKKLGADVAVCDDAFSHLGLSRAVDIVCVNGNVGFGNHRTVPIGPLREPLSALARGAMILVKDGATAIEDIAAIARAHGFAGPVISWRYKIASFYLLKDGLEIDTDYVIGKPVHALAATAFPEEFFRLLEAAGLRVVRRTVRPDHHAWTDADLKRPDSIAASEAVMYHVTTEKDAVKLRRLAPPDESPFLVMRVQPAFSDEDRLTIDQLIKSVS